MKIIVRDKDEDKVFVVAGRYGDKIMVKEKSNRSRLYNIDRVREMLLNHCKAGYPTF